MREPHLSAEDLRGHRGGRRLAVRRRERRGSLRKPRREPRDRRGIELPEELSGQRRPAARPRQPGERAGGASRRREGGEWELNPHRGVEGNGRPSIKGSERVLPRPGEAPSPVPAYVAARRDGVGPSRMRQLRKERVLHMRHERPSNAGEARSSALWGKGSGGQSRGSALWGRGGRSSIALLALVVSVIVPAAGIAGEKQHAAVPADLMAEAQANPTANFDVIVQGDKSHGTQRRRERSQGERRLAEAEASARSTALRRRVTGKQLLKLATTRTSARSRGTSRSRWSVTATGRSTIPKDVATIVSARDIGQRLSALGRARSAVLRAASGPGDRDLRHGHRRLEGRRTSVDASSLGRTSARLEPNATGRSVGSRHDGGRHRGGRLERRARRCKERAARRRPRRFEQRPGPHERHHRGGRLDDREQVARTTSASRTSRSSARTRRASGSTRSTRRSRSSG